MWYMGPMFRHERPQKGRYRQFHQFGLEVFGMQGPDIDAEVILVSARLWQQLGLTPYVRLDLNSLGSNEARAAYRDKLVAYLEQHKELLDEDSQRRLYSNPLRVLDSKNPAMADMLAGAPQLLTVSVLTLDGDGNSLSFEDMGLANTHPRWIGHVMSATPSRRSDHLQNFYAVDVGSAVSPSELHAGLFNGAANNAAGQPERVWTLTGGEDGGEPTSTNYALALAEIASLEDVSIVAAPGSSAYGVDDDDNPQAIAPFI